MNSRRWRIGTIVVVRSVGPHGGRTFVTMAIAQLAGRNSLRDIMENVSSAPAGRHNFGRLCSRTGMPRLPTAGTAGSIRTLVPRAHGIRATVSDVTGADTIAPKPYIHVRHIVAQRLDLIMCP